MKTELLLTGLIALAACAPSKATAERTPPSPSQKPQVATVAPSPVPQETYTQDENGLYMPININGEVERVIVPQIEGLDFEVVGNGHRGVYKDSEGNVVGVFKPEFLDTSVGVYTGAVTLEKGLGLEYAEEEGKLPIPIDLTGFNHPVWLLFVNGPVGVKLHLAGLSGTGSVLAVDGVLPESMVGKDELTGVSINNFGPNNLLRFGDSPVFVAHPSTDLSHLSDR